MRYLTTSACALALMLSPLSVGFAQSTSDAAKHSAEVQQSTSKQTASGTQKSSADIVYGRVESYDAGKSLKVTVPGKIVDTKSFSLDTKDWTYHVPSNLKTGDWVKVDEMTAANGHKTLTVQHSTEHAATQHSSNHS